MTFRPTVKSHFRTSSTYNYVIQASHTFVLLLALSVSTAAHTVTNWLTPSYRHTHLMTIAYARHANHYWELWGRYDQKSNKYIGPVCGWSQRPQAPTCFQVCGGRISLPSPLSVPSHPPSPSPLPSLSPPISYHEAVSFNAARGSGGLGQSPSYRHFLRWFGAKNVRWRW